MSDCDKSFEAEDVVDFATVVAEFPEGDEMPGKQIPIKKLSSEFDNVMTKVGEESMKVYLRVRPTGDISSSTVTIDSSTSIITNAPESSKRAQYTKTEERKYV